MYEENVRTTEDRYVDQQMAIGYRSQLKTRTQDDGESLQEVVTLIEPLIHCAIPALDEEVETARVRD
jgi:hypothetical protein